MGLAFEVFKNMDFQRRYVRFFETRTFYSDLCARPDEQLGMAGYLEITSIINTNS